MNIKNLKINLEKRWENDKEHHPIAKKLAKLIADIDFHHNGDSFDFNFGGDGDNGEDLCYILSEIFERNLMPEIKIGEVNEQT